MHALIVINSYPYAWIIDSGESHHMETIEYVLSSLKSCSSPLIPMGYDSLVEVSRQGKVDLKNGSFENVLDVLKLSHT